MPGGKRMASAPSAPPKRVDQALEGSDHVLELAAAAIEPVDAGIDQQTGFEKPVEKRGLHIHDCHPSRLVSCLWTSSMLDVLPRMRSFEIMSCAECASRRWRPRLKGVPFL